MDLSDKTVLVAGLGISGRSMMEVLRSRAARVIGVDEHKPEADLHSFDDIDWDSADIVMTSPVFNPRTPFILEAQRRGIPVYSEVELAWRLRVDSARTGRPAPWVGITGTNGKTSTTAMTPAMLCADGLVAPAVGNIGKAVSHAAVDPDNDALCVELSSFQLHFTDSLALDCAAITNIADDHLDWHGGIEAYAADKSKVFRNVRRALVFNADDRRVSALASAAHTAEGCRRIGFTLGVPHPGQIGVDDGWIVDRSGVAGGAFGDETRLAPVQEFPHLCEPDGTVYPHLLADAMTALALALGMGVDLDKALASFVIANGAASTGKKVIMFFTFWGLNVIKKREKPAVSKDIFGKMFGWMLPANSEKLKLSKMNMGGAGSWMMRLIMKKKRIDSLESLMAQAVENGIEMIACTMSMDVMGVKKEELMDNVVLGGVATYLERAEDANVNLFI